MTSLNDTINSLLQNKESMQQQAIGVIRVTGSDSKKFLQGQITCDINKLTQKDSLYGAICSIKGRIITNFYIAQKDEDILILMSQDLVEKSLLHLKKYAVFFKVELDDISHELNVFANVSPPTQTSVPTLSSEQLETNTAYSDMIVITLCKHPIQLQWHIVAHNKAMTESNIELDALSLLAAKPLIRLEHSENILPQWLNMQRTGGISFTKGCYTGQEIVARMQYKGKSPKQLALFTSEGNIDSTSQVTDDEGKNIGSIINATRLAGTTYCQIILNIAPRDARNVFVDGEKLLNYPLPYELEG
ncbi:hypothetical protein OAH87_03585 [Marinomonas sp.]|nr:hypothetical protein [Marinomonas sp.]MDB4837530.1 hypothetical protein [Marinomonas sp.]